MKVGMPRIRQQAGGAVRLHCGAQRDCAVAATWLPHTGCSRTMAHMEGCQTQGEWAAWGPWGPWGPLGQIYGPVVGGW
jgi:hypothetical protein